MNERLALYQFIVPRSSFIVSSSPSLLLPSRRRANMFGLFGQRRMSSRSPAQRLAAAFGWL